MHKYCFMHKNSTCQKTRFIPVVVLGTSKFEKTVDFKSFLFSILSQCQYCLYEIQKESNGTFQQVHKHFSIFTFSKFWTFLGSSCLVKKRSLEVVIVHSKSLFQMFYFSDTFFVLYHSAVMQFDFHAQKLVLSKNQVFFKEMFEIRKQYWGNNLFPNS